MKQAIKLDNDVRDILVRAVVEGNVLKITEQLDRKLYQRTNEALEAIGGTWNRKAKGHVFPGDPREAIAAASETGTVAHPNPYDFFETGEDLAERVAEELGALPGDRILEPSVGEAALVRPIVRRLGVTPPLGTLVLVEIDEKRFPALRAQGLGAHVTQADFLTLTPMSPILPGGAALGLFDCIPMNPPFEKGSDTRHIAHAISFLAPGGRLVAIASAGLAFRGDKAARALRAQISAWGGTIEELPEGSFRHAGTSVNTVLVVVDRPEGDA